MNFETAQELFDALCEPFASEEIDWRVGSTSGDKSKGLALAYIDARVCMDRLDSVCGPDGWQCNYVFGNGSLVVCNLGILMPPGNWLWKADGAGATDVEGEKGSCSDALKRAAVRFGIGRYLYELSSPWVALTQMGKSYRIADTEKQKLQDLHDEHARKCGWGLRSGIQAYKLMNSAMKQWVTSPAAAAEFRETNKSMIAQLPVGMRKHLNESLDRIGARAQEAAE